MEQLKLTPLTLIGIRLEEKTTNEGGQSNTDCGRLWQQFEDQNLAAQIADKEGEEIYAVYFDYEPGNRQAFSYFIGCRAAADAEPPVGMSRLVLPGGAYTKWVARGKMPDCMSQAWQEIRQSDMERSFDYDFEVYGPDSRDWNQAVVELFIASKESH